MNRRHPFTLLDLGLVAMWSSGYVGAKLAAETQSVYLVLFWSFPAGGAAAGAGIDPPYRHGRL
ncbi:hypothetical protein NKH93_30945 [Mesorhizobium sp. M0954]|uniref:hypothetical protein n=1 Tax=Mesorhizobium sp. M0954 TaxID=2957032 RepID=UPI00333C9C05